MKVALRDIPCHRRVELPAQFVADAVAGLPMRAALERPAEDPGAGGGAAEVDLYMEGENVFVRGRMDGWVEVACSRCVGPVRVPVDDELFVTFMPSGRIPEEDAEAAGDDAELESDDDDLDYEFEE